MSQAELLTAGFKGAELEEGLAYMELMVKKRGASGAAPEDVETAAELIMPANGFLRLYVEMEGLYKRLEQEGAIRVTKGGDNG